MAEETKDSLRREILDKGFGGEETLRALRDRLAVGEADWEELLRDGGLSGEVLQMGRTMAELCAPWVWHSLLSQTQGGSIPAMKLYFELCKGRGSDQDGDGNPMGSTADKEIASLRQAIFHPAAGHRDGTDGGRADG